MYNYAFDFLSFFLSENVVEGESDNFFMERFENYCKEVELIVVWGG